MRQSRHAIIKWLTPGLRIKRWLALLMFGITVLAIGFAQVIVTLYRTTDLPDPVYLVMLHFLPVWARVLVCSGTGLRRDHHRPFTNSTVRFWLPSRSGAANR